MQKDYDALIDDHYRKVAEKHGLSAASTMEDAIMRGKETDAIVQFVSVCLQSRSSGEAMTIMDIGCGNGYTLEMLLNLFPENQYVGIEKSNELRVLAETRFAGCNNVQVLAGDIRQVNFNQGIPADILICQRVLINLLDLKDQQNALENILTAVRLPVGEKSGGLLLFIEGFTVPFERLNIARQELDLAAITPAYHNLYLPDTFFDHAQLRPFSADQLTPANFLSTHYYLTRVLFPFHTQGKPLKRNSEFVSFFTQALPENVGDYSPVKIHYFERISAPSP
jgi:SAM-dependent methyltransferase